MEWEAAALVLSAVPYGEGGALVHVLTEEHGVFHGLVRGGASRTQSALWQTGNLARVRWRARLSEQLGQISGELIHASCARLLDAPLAMAMIASCCALADGILPEREAFPDLFLSLVRLVSKLSLDPDWVGRGGVAALLRWEADLLAASGFGLDLTCCAVTGDTRDLSYVSPRTGRAVSVSGAGVWRDRLLPLPSLFMNEDEAGSPDDWCAGLALTGFFLARDAFGQRHLPLPAARDRLQARMDTLAASSVPATDV
ncbi:DNA repair protein RecO [Ameyamaea chiangmaiensis NBRC 103196]|uniref:DNA repair protein RecO n=1 Tax=Ameyamaea chiangmaiensis TaxID=442969 RepID=A0A850PAF8_9PROT|nr:DNA repair protein RecO [Ameyamaea chiangmaiensis]MBS4074559.1 DNA repair protein RecO [Ameyamaea chiangmaiensis]NVN39520.1 DNA repair protein RecO [Ameyamaea chiangmaiensis]GBQ72478.1 DNA repair protein RecO [Ameyamaea chiangmaiensis NBRC 103196]